MTDLERLQAARAEIRTLCNSAIWRDFGDLDDIVRALVGFEFAALVQLLVVKGVFTQAEIVALLADKAEQTVARLRALLPPP